jgi:hypothetical protein
MKKLLFLILILTIVLTSCQNINILMGKDSIEDISKNPELYVNKSISLDGKLTYSTKNSFWDINYEIQDYNGFYFPLKTNVSNKVYVGNSYTLEGILMKTDFCICEELITAIYDPYLKIYKEIGKPYYSTLNGGLIKIVVNDCLSRNIVNRCKPNTTETIYYVTANSMRKN